MNAALIGAGAVSVVTASVLISSSSRGPSVVFYEPPAAENGRAVLGDTIVSVAFNETPLPEVFAFIGEALDSDVIVHWGDLEECAVGRDRTVSLKLDRRRSVSQVLGFLRKNLDPGTRQLVLDWRYADGLLELGTVEYFDRRETVMSSFDVGDILARIDEEHSVVRFESIEKLCELVYTYVEPSSWESNGGTIARLMVVGPKMFIRILAPPLIDLSGPTAGPLCGGLAVGQDAQGQQADRLARNQAVVTIHSGMILNCMRYPNLSGSREPVQISQKLL